MDNPSKWFLPGLIARDGVMAIDFEKRVTVPDTVVVRRLDDEMVILDLEAESYFGLDDVGATMWDHLIAAESIAAAYETLLEEFEVEPETLRADLESLVAQLAEARLLEIGGA